MQNYLRTGCLWLEWALIIAAFHKNILSHKWKQTLIHMLQQPDLYIYSEIL